MLQVTSLHQRLSVKSNVFVYSIRSKNTNPKSRKKNKEKKLKKTYRKSSLPFKKIAIKVYFHIRGQATGHPKQPRQQQMTIFTGQFARPSNYDSATCCGFSYGEISN